MRRRLINSTLAVVLVVIAVFGVSLVIVETRTISASAQESVESEALRLISVVDSRLLGDEVINSGVLSEQIDPNRFALIEIPGRAPIAVGERPTGSVLRASETGEQGEKVTVEESRSAVTREVGRTLLIIGAVALLAIISAVLLAVRQANRLASPSPTSPRPPNASAPATPARATSGTGCPSWTGSPTSWTLPPSGSPGC
ncbi:hypothetical protein Smic_29740 [Streptomyces microflavus]|uniref:Histidine kinase DraK N-terminal domain-containing protein n=1 Tax=Streptomyces microflavus TaxID=1919 RepID=A0A7J0CQ26_STRMI|nr:hypothetical protein Smic_29740 [Streptomyces microflavus]